MTHGFNASPRSAGIPASDRRQECRRSINLLMTLLLCLLPLTVSGAEIRVTKELKVPAMLNGETVSTATLTVGRTLTVVEDADGKLIAALGGKGSLTVDLSAHRDCFEPVTEKAETPKPAPAPVTAAAVPPPPPVASLSAANGETAEPTTPANREQRIAEAAAELTRHLTSFNLAVADTQGRELVPLVVALFERFGVDFFTLPKEWQLYALDELSTYGPGVLRNPNHGSYYKACFYSLGARARFFFQLSEVSPQFEPRNKREQWRVAAAVKIKAQWERETQALLAKAKGRPLQGKPLIAPQAAKLNKQKIDEQAREYLRTGGGTEEERERRLVAAVMQRLQAAMADECYILCARVHVGDCLVDYNTASRLEMTVEGAAPLTEEERRGLAVLLVNVCSALNGKFTEYYAEYGPELFFRAVSVCHNQAAAARGSGGGAVCAICPGLFADARRD